MEKVTYTYNVPLVGDVQLECYDLGAANHRRVLTVSSFSVTRNKEIYDVKSLIPEYWMLRVQDHPVRWHADSTYKRVIIGYPNSLENVTSALHEIGHARDLASASVSKQQKIANRRWWWNEDPHTMSFDELSGILTEECDAWAFAVQELQGLQLSNEAMNQVYRHITAPGEVQGYLRYMTKHLLPAIAQSAQRNPQEINEMLITQYSVWKNNMKEQCGVEK